MMKGAFEDGLYWEDFVGEDPPENLSTGLEDGLERASVYGGLVTVR